MTHVRLGILALAATLLASCAEKNSRPPKKKADRKQQVRSNAIKPPRSPATKYRPAMRRLAGGWAWLGLPKDVRQISEPGLARFQRHKVKLAPFWVAETETTQAQYFAVTGKSPLRLLEGGPGPSYLKCATAGVGDKLPVVCATWLEAIRYCNTLSKREGRAPYYLITGQKVSRGDGAGYRLLTGDEWEYAAKGGQEVVFAGTSDKQELCRYANVHDLLAECSSSYKKLAPVASLRPNDWGLFDFSGNAREWVDGWVYAGSHYEVRGGSYKEHPYQTTRVYEFSAWTNDWRDSTMGVRIGRSLDRKMKSGTR